MDPQDEPAGQAVEEDELDRATDVVDDAYTYFGVTADPRKCASPMCGGWFLTRLNRATTRCHDGGSAASCYTPVLDWSRTNLSEGQRATMLDACSKGVGTGGVYAIVRGRFARFNDTTPAPELGRFVIDEAWVAHSDTVSAGVFVKVRDNGLRCFTTPCPSITEITLNRRRSADIAGVDWAPAELNEGQIAACVDAMASPDGMLMAGDRYPMWGDAGFAEGRTATAAYYRLGDAAP